MLRLGQLLRLFTIQYVLIKHGVDEMLFAIPLLRPFRWVLYLLPWNWRRRDYAPMAVRLRNVLEALGPIYIKFGQILSTRRDLLPEDIAEEFSKLQDRVPPFAGAQARAVVEAALSKSVRELFTEFDETALASASVAQVHAATLPDQRKVIVKVIRPGIAETIKRDLGLLQILAEGLERYTPHGRRLKPTGVVEEFERTLMDELDLLREAANASQLKRNFAGSAMIHVPEIIWDLTRREVLVMERVSGIRADDVAALRAADVDLRRLAEMGVELFFTQVFRDHFFHADVHPGNLFVEPLAGGGARFIPVDFGIMGSLSDFDQRYLAENFLAFMRRDYRRVAELHIESGWVPRDTRMDQFEFAIRTVCEPIFDRPVKEISVGHLLLRLFQTAQRFHMRILPQLLLLQKTLVNVEGIGRQLYPDLDLWAASRPSLEQWLTRRLSLRRLLRQVRERAPGWVERLPALPDNLLETLAQLKTNSADAADTRDENLWREQLYRMQRLQRVTLIGALLWLTGVAVLLTQPLPQWLGVTAAVLGFCLLGYGLTR